MAKRAGNLMRLVGWSRLVGAGVLVLFLGLRVLDPAPVSGLRLAVFDLYQQSHPRSFAPAPVTILDIDDASLSELGQWPWPRTRVADLVDKATAAGAVAIAFDVVFAEPDRLSPGQIARDNAALPGDVRSALTSLPDNDAALAAAFARSRVIAGQTSLRRSEGQDAPQHTALEPVPHAVIGPDPRPWLLTFPRAVRNLPELEEAAAGQGVFSVRPDADGVYRRVPLVMVVEDQFRLGLAPELLRVATGAAPFAIRSNEAGVEGVVLARQLVATDRDGTVWPWLTPSTPARFISAADLLADRLPPDRLTGQLVLVGTSAIGLEDFRPTPLGTAMAGVEIHAQVLENILGNTMLLRPNYAIGAELILIALMGVIVILATPMIPALWLAIGSLIMLGGVAAASYASFVQWRLLMDASWPLATTLTLIILLSTGNYLREEQRRRRIRNAFGQYVSPALVAQLSDREDDLKLGGETRDITLLFSDVRGFTAISEGYKSDPQGLTSLMNELLTVLSEPILKEGGTIDKFMGDAVMAFWNAPLDHAAPEAAACRSALAMRDAAIQLNTSRAATLGESAPDIRVGLGVNSGACVVGNMGSSARFDYTALGDAVNLASRLEGQSKTYGVDIVLGDTTCRAVSGTFATLELDRIRVRGKSEPETVHALLGDEALRRTPAFAALAAASAALLEAYRAQDWGQARSSVDRVEAAASETGLDLRVFCALYRARIDDLEAAPPGTGWDGVFTATSK